MFFVVSLIVTVAPATAAPLASRTMPTMLPVMCCAWAGIAMTARPKSSNRLTAFLMIGDIGCLHSLLVSETTVARRSWRALLCYRCAALAPLSRRAFSIQQVLLPDAGKLRQPALPDAGQVGGGLPFFQCRQRRAIGEQAQVIVNFPGA